MYFYIKVPSVLNSSFSPLPESGDELLQEDKDTMVIN